MPGTATTDIVDLFRELDVELKKRDVEGKQELAQAPPVVKKFLEQREWDEAIMAVVVQNNHPDKASEGGGDLHAHVVSCHECQMTLDDLFGVLSAFGGCSLT